MPKYRCLECGRVADIDTAARTKRMEFKGERKQGSFPRPGHTCELAKGIDHIDFSKLQRVE